MNNFLLYRMNLMDNSDEINAIQKYWNGKSSAYRSWVPEYKTVIGRYSVLPYYNELEAELKTKNSWLINSYNQHLYISKMKWYDTLKFLINTPKTYFYGDNEILYTDIPDFKNGCVVKGETNSRKFQWNTCMYAKDKKALNHVISNLLLDTLISQQRIVIREYIPLEKIEIGINGLNISNEWRLFFYKENLIDYGYYWSIAKEYPKLSEMEKNDLIIFAKKIANIIKHYTNFFVLDIAKTENGEWILIEINDGQMSGLSTIDPFNFYNNLFNILKEN